MKKLLAALMILVFASLSWAETHECPNKDKEAEAAVVQQCPKTLMTEKCLYCHVSPTFRIKEADPHEPYKYPLGFKFGFDEKGKPLVGRYVMETIDADKIADIMDYCAQYKVDHIVLELQSPGGSLYEGYKIVGLMREWSNQGKIIETRCYGFAISAGFLIFATGTEGYRFAAPNAELMWHELWTLTWLSIDTPSSKEDEAKVMRHLQDNANAWLAQQSKMTKEEIDEAVKYKDFWMNGVEAVEYGFADALLVRGK